MSQSNNPNVTASYTSPTNEPFSITETIPAQASSASSVDEKTKYLSALRQALSSTQDFINRQLTTRMELDKAQSGNSTAANKGGVDEALEEENYGEEAQGED